MLAGGENPANLVAYGLPKPDLFVADQLLAAHRACRDVLTQVSGLQTGWTIATQAFEPSGPDAQDMLHQVSYPAEDWYLENAAGDDFIGVQAYTRNIVGPEGIRPHASSVETTLTGWEYFLGAAAIGVRAARSLSDHTPIMVTENGIATADDQRRIDYTRDALADLHS